MNKAPTLIELQVPFVVMVAGPDQMILVLKQVTGRTFPTPALGSQIFGKMTGLNPLCHNSCLEL